MLGLFKRAPKLEAGVRPTVAVARELTREVEVRAISSCATWAAPPS